MPRSSAHETGGAEKLLCRLSLKWRLSTEAMSAAA
jgi:hypothetical protein